jgi:hypothetical protein
VNPGSTYKYSAYSIWLSLFGAVFISWFFIWNEATPANFLDGDAWYYYYYLQSTFIDPNLAHYDWLNDATPVTHHPAGLSILLLPFFLIGLSAAKLFHFSLSGISLPFQVSVAVAALVYGITGLVYLRKLFRLNGISDKVTALIILLTFFGTTLLHYTISEGGMSHVYSFCLITVFMYHSCRFVKEHSNKHLLYSSVIFALVLLVRANNGFAIFTILFWFADRKECVTFFKNLVRNPAFYKSLIVFLGVLCIQPLMWLWKENTFFTDRYAAYGFYWTKPAFFNMLFGFNAGFFIYAPLCLLFLAGLVNIYKASHFSFYASLGFILLLFYFFSAYSAYTYYDGIGIRVLVDYYAVFAFFGAKLFNAVETQKVLFSSLTVVAFLLASLNLVYCYQVGHSIMLRSGMTFNQWKYIFMRTGNEYKNSLGGCNDLVPYSKEPVAAALTSEMNSTFDYAKKDFGISAAFDSIGFASKRICMKLNIGRTEVYANSSRNAMVCAELQDSAGKKKSYMQFRLNETPSKNCCEESQYHYTATMDGDFKTSDRFSVYLWNSERQPFFINKFSVEVYNYNY